MAGVQKVVSIPDLQTRARHVVKEVRETDQPVVITQRGRAVAVLVSVEAYEGFTATSDETSYRDWESRLRRARREAMAGKGVPLETYVARREKR